MPGDAVPGSTIPEDTDAEALLHDGTWILCPVVGQRKDRHGRWCIGIRWYASPSIGGREGWYILGFHPSARVIGAVSAVVSAILPLVLRYGDEAANRPRLTSLRASRTRAVLSCFWPGRAGS